MQYRILMLDGSVSTKLYDISEEVSGGHKVSLKSVGDTLETVVHKNRLIPFEKKDCAICIVSSGIEMVICPKCLSITRKVQESVEFECSNNCGKYEYHDLISANSVARSMKVNNLKQKNVFDPEAIKAYPSMVVYSKTNKFNHPQIDSRSVVILHKSDKPRKMQFNTYNGSLGKKAGALPLEAFDKNEIPHGKCPWVPIASFEAEEQRLKADGYVLIV